MFMRMIYDERLAQAAYLIGCQRTGEALVIDPERDVDRYIDLARQNGLRITAIAETHIHADFLSGSRELAEQTGATLYLSGEGGPDWSYRWLDKKTGGGSYKHVLLKDADTFRVGNIDVRAMHTPGHTPEHLCFVITDRGGGASEPMGVATGDFVFVGDLGRPDLLESAAGVRGMADSSARVLFKSVQKFSALPEYLQVWPAHGAGSACGKALGAVPQTTVGYEKRFNASIKAAGSESQFVDYILSGQPEPPLYFARMKHENRDGPAVLGTLPKPHELSDQEITGLSPAAFVVDTRSWKDFKEGHLKGSLFAPRDGMFHTVVGSYIPASGDIYLIAHANEIDGLVRDLVRIGLDRVMGYITPHTLAAFAHHHPQAMAKTAEIDAARAKVSIATEKPFLLDVRAAWEYAEGHIPGAMHAAYPHLPKKLAELPKDRPILVNCKAGGRSARACAFLEREGFRVTNLAGGFGAWEQFGGPVQK
jgi:hydroxyacylglutathione hydrolase